MAKILVCDDDKEIVEAIEIYLTQDGHQVLEAYDGIEAVEILKKESVDLLIMDIMMPRMDGIRATLKIREKHNIPIIILSAKSEDADKILGLNIGADDYITKPFNPLELVARVKSHLRRYMQLGSTTIKESEAIYTVGGLAINDDLKYLSLKCGFGTERYRFDGAGAKTATEIISENSDMYRMLKKHETILEDVLKRLIRIIIRLGIVTGNTLDQNTDVVIDFDDSIIEDKGAERQQDRQDVSMGVMRHEEYRAKWYGETVEQAKKNLPEQNQVME